jgi:hypothetical protein
MFPIAFHSIYKHPLPDGHRFPMLKYDLLPQQLLIEGTAVERGAERLEAACHDRAPLGGVHVSLCTPERLVSFWTQK